MDSALTPGPLELNESQSSSKLSSVNPSDMDSVSGGPGPGASDNDSDSDDSSDDGRESEAAPQVEWLAMGRERRSTAGNRMKSMLANEEPDSDLELLFAEDENDQGFSDAADNASDVQMDSSSDDDDNDADELEGEKELDREAKERRAAQRKRKAQDAIPAKFRKKVRIDTRASTPRSSVTASTPQPPATRRAQTEQQQQPRPKKKSERSSWLPSVADMPTRASSRQTTRLSKEQLHAQMEEREAKRLKQVAQMQKKAARLEALKKPPMTQEERLQEAAKVEERNSKSLNRWEESEKLREEERRAKLAALQQRTLSGPVITFWSGMGKFGDGWRKGEGIHVAVEEKPKKAKREKPAKAAAGKKKDDATGEITVGSKSADAQADAGAKLEPTVPNSQAVSYPAVNGDSKTSSEEQKTKNESPAEVTSKDEPVPEGAKTQGKEATETTAAVPVPEIGASTTSSGKSDLNNHTESDVAMVDAPATENIENSNTTETGGQSDPKQPQAAMTGTSGETKPLEPLSKDVEVSIKADADTVPELKPSVASEVPATLETPEKTSAFTQVPVEQTQPQPASTTEKTADSSVAAPTKTNAGPGTVTAKDAEAPKQTALQPIENESLPASKVVSQIQSAAATPQPEQARSPLDGLATTRTAIIYQNFDENAIKDRAVQTQILFGRKMTRMPSTCFTYAKAIAMPVLLIYNKNRTDTGADMSHH